MRSRYRCSMCPAIHINSRSWLRSSSTHEPSDPPLRVVIFVSGERSPSGIVNRRVAPPGSPCNRNEPASTEDHVNGGVDTATTLRLRTVVT